MKRRQFLYLIWKDFMLIRSLLFAAAISVVAATVTLALNWGRSESTEIGLVGLAKVSGFCVRECQYFSTPLGD